MPISKLGGISSMDVRKGQAHRRGGAGDLIRQVLLGLLALGTPSGLLGGAGALVGEERRRFEESETRAAFLFVFAEYTEWPTPRLAAKEPFVMGVVGDSPVGRALEKLAPGAHVQGHRVVVRQLKGLGETAGCHLVYFPALAERQLPEARRRLAEEGVLTVGETNFFVGFGGAVHLFQEEGSLRFVVNRAVLDQSRLRVASRALNLAKKVINEP